MSRVPPLNALRCFEAVARLGSVTRAANELHLTHAAVSQQVKGLEHQLGMVLFERQGRGIEVTGDGRVYAEQVRQLLEAVPLAVDAAAVMNGLMASPPATSGRAAWVLDDAVRLEAATPLLANAVMLARAEQLELHETPAALPRLGPYQDPSEIL